MRPLIDSSHSNEALTAASQFAPLGEQRTDGLGNVYYRLSTENDRIHRLTSGGVDEVVPLDANGLDVIASDSGNLYELGNDNRRQVWISEFAPSGTKISTTVLRPRSSETWLVGIRLARFSSGNFLVLGYQFAKDTGKANPLIAVFDQDGFFVSDVYLNTGGQKQQLSVGAMGFFDAASLGAAALDSEGDHVYLAMPGIDKPLLTIEPTGAISKVLPINESKEGMKLMNFRVKQDRAVLGFQGNTTLPDGRKTIAAVYKIFDLKSGKLVSSFHQENFIGTVVSFNGQEEFTSFVSLPDRKYLIHVAGGRR
jgi:hypothetical protein